MASLENKYGKSAVDATRRNALPPYLDTLFEGGIGGGAGVETHNVILTTANWNNLQQNVVLTCGATNASDVICAGDNSTMDADYYLSAFGVKLTSASVVEGKEEGANTVTFTFTATSTPTTNINVVIIIVNASTEGGVPVATISRVGVVKPDGTTISIDSNGTIHSIGGGGGGGSVTGVKGDTETDYRVGNVNLTPANIGAVPTSTTVNGHALTGNITISKSDVGLGNVDNTSDANKPISTATQTALDGKVDKVTGKGLSTNDFADVLLTKLNGIESGAQKNTVTGIKGGAESSYRVGNVNITKANIGLGNVDNTSDTNKPISTATQAALDNKVDKVTGKGLSTNDFTDTLLSKLNGIESGAQVNTVTGVKGNAEASYRTGNINITKANIGLGNVDNTSDVNKPISTATQTALNNKVDKVTGKGLSTNDFTTAEKNKLSGIESGAQVNTVTGVKGNAESSYRTGNVNLTKTNIGLGDVDNTKQMPISGGTFTNLDNVFFTASVGSVLVGSQTTSILNSPEAKYIWHDVWAFCRAQTPTYEVTTNGSTWASATLEKRLFAHQNAWGKFTILTSTQTGVRWTWTNGGFAYSSAPWLAIGVTYTNPVATFDVKLESSADSFATSTVLVNKQGISANQVPIFIRTNTSSQNGLRLTITKNSGASSESTLTICGLMLLSYRWGDQGKGEEYEHPYTWDANYNLSPLSGASFVGNLTGTASKATADANGNNIVNTYATKTALNAKVNKTDIATTSALGLVKPDGNTVTIDADGTIHSQSSGFGFGGVEMHGVDLAANAWSNKTQTVTISTYAIATSDFLSVPQIETSSEYSASGVVLSSATVNVSAHTASLVFSCTTVPTATVSTTVLVSTSAMETEVALADAIANYPKIQNGKWYVWNVSTKQWVDTGVKAGITSIVQTTTSTADGGTNVVTATLSDGTKTTFNIKNGQKGDKGDKGDAGATLTTATISLASGSWTASGNLYTQSATISWMLSTDIPFCQGVCNNSTDAENWGQIIKATSANGSITFTALEPLSANLSVQIVVLR